MSWAGFIGIIAFAFGLEGFISRRMAIWETGCLYYCRTAVDFSARGCLVISPVIIALATISQFWKKGPPCCF